MDSLTSRLLAGGPFSRPDAPFRLVEVAGPDAGDFLQRLCSQDVLGLAEERVAPAAFLDAKGKLQVTCLGFRLGGSFWLEVQQEQASRLLELLERYHFTEKLVIAPRELGSGWEYVSFGGGTPEQNRAIRREEPEGLVVQFERRGIMFVRSYGSELHMENVRDDDTTEPVVHRALTPELAECLRMAAGFVRVGVETEPNTLALEADLDDHCSTTKGCYTGQEIVARIHTYGHVNRRLCLLHLADGPEITAAEPLHEPEDDAPVGRVLHAVKAPGQAMRVGLGYLPADFQAIGTKLRLADGAEVAIAGFEPLHEGGD
jgi:folate-binding protein YgfZ